MYLGKTARHHAKLQLPEHQQAGFALLCQTWSDYLFWTDDQRLNILALLLENAAIDTAVMLGAPMLWRQAIDERLKTP